MLVRVKQCVDVVDRINELADRRDREQDLLSSPASNATPEETESRRKRIEAWNAEIAQLHGPFQPTETAVRAFVEELRNCLDTLPIEPPQLRAIRSEIERLELWTAVRKRPPPGMRRSYADLLKVKQRLDDLLGYLSKDEAQRAPGGRATSGGASPAELIGGWCAKNRVSQRGLTRRAGISPLTLRKIMEGKPVREEKIAALAQALDCRYEDLLPK